MNFKCTEWLPLTALNACHVVCSRPLLLLFWRHVEKANYKRISTKCSKRCMSQTGKQPVYTAPTLHPHSDQVKDVYSGPDQGEFSVPLFFRKTCYF